MWWYLYLRRNEVYTKLLQNCSRGRCKDQVIIMSKGCAWVSSSYLSWGALLVSWHDQSNWFPYHPLIPKQVCLKMWHSDYKCDMNFWCLIFSSRNQYKDLSVRETYSSTNAPAFLGSWESEGAFPQIYSRYLQRMYFNEESWISVETTKLAWINFSSALSSDRYLIVRLWLVWSLIARYQWKVSALHNSGSPKVDDVTRE